VILVDTRILLTPIFSQTMARNRFQLFLRYLHFTRNTTTDPNTDDTYKIQPVLDFPTETLKINYIPQKELSLDKGNNGVKGTPAFFGVQSMKN
jgi:hypothetical protein